MSIWRKFADETPEHYRELIIRQSKDGAYEYNSAMSVEDYKIPTGRRVPLVEHTLEFRDAPYKHYLSVEMSESFEPSEAPDIEWCYLEDLCKLAENKRKLEQVYGKLEDIYVDGAVVLED